MGDSERRKQVNSSLKLIIQQTVVKISLPPRLFSQFRGIGKLQRIGVRQTVDTDLSNSISISNLH